jgi:uncharacterized protein (DUF1330 family)
MARGYWLARLNIKNPDMFAEYRKRNAAPLSKFGGKFIVKGGKAEARFGPAAAENVVIEFESYAQAVACFDSSEYQAATQYLKQSADVIEFVIAEGAE